MSKHMVVAIAVLCFVGFFLTMVYEYGSHGWSHESNIPGHTQGAVHEGTPSEAKPGNLHTSMPSNAGIEPTAAEPAVNSTPDAVTEESVGTGTPAPQAEVDPQPTSSGAANQSPEPATTP